MEPHISHSGVRDRQGKRIVEACLSTITDRAPCLQTNIYQKKRKKKKRYNHVLDRTSYNLKSLFLSRDVRCNYVDTTHVSIVKRGRAECCCDLGERNVLATECCSELGVRNVIVTVGREIFDTRTTISERVVIG